MKKRSLKLFAAVAVAGVAVAALAAGSASGDDSRSRDVAPGQCVSAPLDNTVVVDEQTLYVDDYAGRAVLLHMTGRCMTEDEAVGFKFFGSSRICGPLDVDVTGSLFTMPSPCLIESVEALSKEDAKAYKDGK